MPTFSYNQHDFLLNGEPFKILSGAVHYFRIVPEHWHQTLYNLKAMGCNTVETYVPWNLHEPREGQFYFEENADLCAFLDVAKALDLWVILRPTHYICAEWEFGGLPAWLLKYPTMKVRTSQPLFLEKVENYYRTLLPKVTPYQITHGGNIILMQIENEYGSFGNDKNYLRHIKNLMQKFGVNVPLCTSDGPWFECINAGSLIEDDVLPMGNFGSKSNKNLDDVERFFALHNKRFPLMCMEFWDGWFNRWGEPIVRRDAQDLANDVAELLQRASINLYMFCGGTNFGLMNASSNRKHTDFPQTTSYDYDAPLTEWGMPTEKYRLLRALFAQYNRTPTLEPLIPSFCAYPAAKLTAEVSLFNTLHVFPQQILPQPNPMEMLDCYYGYMLYRSHIATQPSDEPCKLRVIDALDRIQIYQNQQFLVVQNQHEIGDELWLDRTQGDYQLDILCENRGRVSYGARLWSPTSQKGIRGGVMVDYHYHGNEQQGWQHIALDLSQLPNIDFGGEAQIGTPSFYRYEFEIDGERHNTFLDCRSLGRGVAFINGFNLGRFCEEGEQAYLYIPAPKLIAGKNSLIIFETEGKRPTELAFAEKPIYQPISKE